MLTSNNIWVKLSHKQDEAKNVRKITNYED